MKIKKQKAQKKCFLKRKLKFENYKNCLEATQLDNKINYLEKNKIDIDSLKRDHKEFIKNNKLILKTQQRFKSERYNMLMRAYNLNKNKITRSFMLITLFKY